MRVVGVKRAWSRVGGTFHPFMREGEWSERQIPETFKISVHLQIKR